ncbi:hypothetical protein GALMADRAFT_280755 [Galerina marginata CBS 339.88]|uniref:Uncharacterized protein n=1 Tax=Galerina marginata (strain CBS 339.88) TaxID=685588 RepID=A0A067T0Z6_GALM3|nr:hypothetical protein GALMADRAFT_280755 [Galerina marginata CBS 339.88]
MLLRFTSPDMLNTSLIDVVTGEQTYDIVTVLVDPTDPAENEEHSPSANSTSSPVASSSKPCTPTAVGSSRSSKNKRLRSSDSGEQANAERRQTRITDATGNVVAHILWKGRRPDITICDEKVGALTDLFGSTTVRFMPKALVIPTRFDTEYIWTATPNSLTLFDYDTETIKGTFYQNAIRIPMRSKVSKLNLRSSSKPRLSSKSTDFLSSPASTTSLSTSSTVDSESGPDTKPHKPTLITTRFPGVGSNYLEFSPHPLAHDVEIILSFLMMEILRRGRFSLTPYAFEKPKLWQFKEARDLFMRRLRRNTV